MGSRKRASGVDPSPGRAAAPAVPPEELWQSTLDALRQSEEKYRAEPRGTSAWASGLWDQ